MKGLELSYEFYRQYGEPMLQKDFSHILPVVAVGMAGSGSECFGYDDELSRDHDFEPGFCIFIPDESVVDEKTAFELQRAYDKLPREFMGFSRSIDTPVGGRRNGVIRMAEFFTSKAGTPDGRLHKKEWFFVPEQGLLEATNGRVFKDDSGEFTDIRQRLINMPRDVQLKKLAGNILTMGQAGQYNYNRCIGRGETAAAQLAVTEFVKSAIHTIFLLNGEYMPYYKWCFKVLRDLSALGELHSDLEYLISSSNDEQNAMKKVMVIEDVCSKIVEQLRVQNLTTFNGAELEGHAYSVNNMISDGEIRNLHILYGV
jgi:hypothetical protein